MSKKQNLGQFNTSTGVWLRPHIRRFIYGTRREVIVDPFAGHGDLLRVFPNHGKVGYDIDPDLCTDVGWAWNDSLDAIPYHSDAIVVTNPPYLAKNSAARNDLESYDYFRDPDNVQCEDLYQIAIRKVLENYTKAVFIIPETYFQTNLFKDYLESFTIIEENPFIDTDCPVGVACFNIRNDFTSMSNNNYTIWRQDDLLFDKNTLEDALYSWKTARLNNTITFNAPEGQLGLRAVDGVSPGNRIRFAKPKNLQYDLRKINETSRSITSIDVPGHKINKKFIQHINFCLREFRKDTKDVVLSPFKNNNKLGIRRRRLDYHWARKIIEKAVETLDK
jgi:hypothetical protein